MRPRRPSVIGRSRPGCASDPATGCRIGRARAVREYVAAGHDAARHLAGSFGPARRTEMAGIVRIDGISYPFAGAPASRRRHPHGGHGRPPVVRGLERALGQSLLEITPTRSRFYLEGGGIRLIVEFLSPVETGDLRAQSIPMSYVLMTASSLDGRPHDVQMYIDISGEWAAATTPGDHLGACLACRAPDGDLQVWTVRAEPPAALTEQDQLAAWGTSSGRPADSAGLTLPIRARHHRPGPVRAARTPDEQRRHQLPRDRNDNWPVFAFSADLGRVTGLAVTMPLFIGQHPHARLIRYLAMTSAAVDHGLLQLAGHAQLLPRRPHRRRPRADSLDARITADATSRRRPGLRGTVRDRPAPGVRRHRTRGRPRTASRGPSSRRSPATATSPPSTSSIRRLAAWIYADPGYLGLLLEPLLGLRRDRRLAEDDTPCTTSARRTRTPPGTTTAAKRTCRSKNPATC